MAEVTSKASNPRRKIAPLVVTGSVAMINKKLLIFECDDDMDLFIERLCRKSNDYEFLVIRRQNP